MNEIEFAQWIYKNYTIGASNPMARELLENVLEYAEGMAGDEQYRYFCQMIPQVPEAIIRQVSY